MSRNRVSCSVCRKRLAAYGVDGEYACQVVLPSGEHTWRCVWHTDNDDAVSVADWLKAHPSGSWGAER